LTATEIARSIRFKSFLEKITIASLDFSHVEGKIEGVRKKEAEIKGF